MGVLAEKRVFGMVWVLIIVTIFGHTKNRKDVFPPQDFMGVVCWGSRSMPQKRLRLGSPPVHVFFQHMFRNMVFVAPKSCLDVLRKVKKNMWILGLKCLKCIESCGSHTSASGFQKHLRQLVGCIRCLTLMHAPKTMRKAPGIFGVPWKG